MLFSEKVRLIRIYRSILGTLSFRLSWTNLYSCRQLKCNLYFIYPVDQMFVGLYMLPNVKFCGRRSCCILMKRRSHKSDAIIKFLAVYEYSSSRYPPCSLYHFPFCIGWQPGKLHSDVSLLWDTHVSCRQMALKWIVFSSKYDRKPRNESAVCSCGPGFLSYYPAEMNIPQIGSSNSVTFENDNTWLPGRTWRATVVFRPIVTCCHTIQSCLFGQGTWKTYYLWVLIFIDAVCRKYC